MIRVPLAPWELAWATSVGTGRTVANAGRADAAHYDRSRMEDDTRAHIAGAICEMAVAKYLNRYWSGAVWPADQHHRYATDPDIAPDIEVRRVRNRSGSLPVRQRDAERQRLMVQAFAVEDQDGFFAVDLIGAIPAVTGWAIGSRAPYAPNTTRLVPQQHLAPFKESGAA